MDFKKFRVSTRLALAFGMVLAISLMAAALSIYKLSSLHDDLREVVMENNVKLKLNYDMSNAVHIVSRIMRSLVLLSDKADMDRETVKLRKVQEDHDLAWAALEKFPAVGTARENRAQIELARNTSRPLNERVIEFGLQNKSEEATSLLFKEANPATQKWQDALGKNIAFQQQHNEEKFQRAESNYENARLMLICTSALSLAMAILLGWMVTRSITSQLGGEPAAAAALAQAVADGDLSNPIALRAGDTHSMMASLHRMQESLAKVVGRVRSGSESVSTASAEIAQGNYDLSARTEEQASSLEETAASMEQLSATVKQNADSANQANQLAINASAVAVKGGEVVGQVVETMKGINESSRKISDIISVIDGIAFQTNILALNAAVEAARAGEQGRGFAVVATEVRSLAGRSADAAKEIKSLIGTSVERVEFGTNLVDQAGATMSEVVNSIKRVTDLMGEISAASNEQSAGVSQVGEAVVQMDQVTQQNAALVEEMAAAANSLKSQAHDLVQTVAVFKLSQHEHAIPHAAVQQEPSAQFAASALPSPSARKTGTVAKPRAVAAKPKSNPVKIAGPRLAAVGGMSGEWDSF